MKKWKRSVCLIFAMQIIILFSACKDTTEVVDAPQERITLEVYNGLRQGSITLNILEILRRDGRIDVRTIEKSPTNMYPRTIILDRKGNRQKMEYLAEMLGLPKERILIQKSNQRLDATLVVGIDYTLITEKFGR